MGTTEVSDRTIRLRGELRLFLAPQHLNSLTERGMEADCLSFQISNSLFHDYEGWTARPVEYTLRLKAARTVKVEEEQAEASTSKERMLLDSLTSKEAVLFDSSCLVQAVLYDATMEVTDLLLPDDDAVTTDLTSSDDDVLEIAELPTRHILLKEGEIGKPLVQRAVKRHVITLSLYSLQEAVRHLPDLLANLPPSTSLRHVCLLFTENRDGMSAGALDRLTAALTRSSLEGVSFQGPFSNFFDAAAFHSLLNSMTYLGFVEHGQLLYLSPLSR